jgi:N-acetylglutamate synthase-like GNAT family acetyltransferase
MEGESSVHDVTLRRATEEDETRLARMVGAGGTLLSAVTVRPAGILVAELAGTPVGFIGLEILGGDGLLGAACVAAEWSADDVGRLLVEATLTEGALQALDSVYLFTEGSQPFFARFGFLVIHRDEVPSPVRRWAEMHGGLTPTAVAMHVRLLER